MYRYCTRAFKRKRVSRLLLILFGIGIFTVFQINSGISLTFRRTLYLKVTTAIPTTVGPTIHRRGFTEMKFGPVNILGVVGGNSSAEVIWDIYKVYAHINITRYNENDTIYSCCMKYWRNGVEIVKTRALSSFIYSKYRMKIGLYYFVCPNTRHYLGHTPAGVAITVAGMPCTENEVVFIEPYHTLREPGRKLVIGTKLAFADLSAEMVIEWMEAYRYLGVDKVVAYYVSDLNENAVKVLKFYASTGILDLYFYQPSWSDVLPRDFRTLSNLLRCDEQIVVYDIFERYSGYMYFGIIDFDEFLIPGNHKTLKEMIEDIFIKSPKVVVLHLKSQYFFTSWGKSGSVNDMILGTYVNRTVFGPEMERRKNILKPEYITPGRYSTHNALAFDGYLGRVVFPKEGFLRHYRSCRNDIHNHENFDCEDSSQRVTDTSMAKWSMKILSNVRRVRQLIFGTDKAIG